MPESMPDIRDNSSLPSGGAEVYAEIVIPLALPKNYTWAVPGTLRDSVHIGCPCRGKPGKE